MPSRGEDIFEAVVKLLEKKPVRSIAGGGQINVRMNGGGGGTTVGSRGLSAGKPGYPVPQEMLSAEHPEEVDEAKKKGKDLGFGFNEEGYPLQDRYEFQGLPISVENKKGSTRKWYDPDGKEKGSTKMHFDYGYVEGAIGADEEPVDVYIGPDEDAEFVFVVHQNKAPDFEEYDEDKVMLGFSSEEDAREAYLKQYDDEQFYGGMSSMPIEKFKEKLLEPQGPQHQAGKITNEIMNVLGELLGEGKEHTGFFCGLKIPDEAASSLAVPGGEPAEKLHVTLLYQKEWDADERKKVVTIIKKNSMKLLPIKASISELGRFPATESSDGKDVIYAQVDSPELHHFRELVMKAIEKAGLSNPQKFEYKPHVTLAYVDAGEPSPIEEIEANDIELDELIFTGIESPTNESHLGPAKIDGDDIAPKVGGQTVDQLMDKIAEDLQEPEPFDTRQKDPFDFSQGTLSSKFKQLEDIEDDTLGRLSKMIENSVISEKSQAPTVGVTIGRFQPFHKGHGEIIRRLARQFSRVIVLVAGNDDDKSRNPFSYDLRIEVMEKSLGDVWSKLQVAKAEFNGKPSGYVPGIISDLVQGDQTSIKSDTAVNIMVGADRYADIKKQIEHAKKDGSELFFDPDLAMVKMLPDVKSDDQSGRISSTQVRQALADRNEAALKDLMDPLLVSNRATFEDVVGKLEGAMGGELEEDLKDIGGTKGARNVLDMNAEPLLRIKRINVKSLKELGHGIDGVSYEIGGNKVMKLTTDLSEAKTSLSAVGKDKKHVVHVYDVFRLEAGAIGAKTNEPSPTIGANEPAEPRKTNVSQVPAGKEGSTKGPMVFGIVEEKLTPLSAQEQTEFEEGQKIWYDSGAKIYDLFETWDLKRVMKAIHQEIERQVSSSPDIDRFSDDFDDEISKRYNRIRDIMEKFQFPAIIADLKDLKIQYRDFHSGNILKRGSDYVVTDLGRAHSDGNVEPPLIETVVEGIIAELGPSGAGGSMGGAVGSGPGSVGLRASSSAWSTGQGVVSDDPDNTEDGDEWRRKVAYGDKMQKTTRGTPDVKNDD